MSFYINNNNQNKPGVIHGNPLNHLCERALIEVPKIFDACIIKCSDSGIILNASGNNPAGPAEPLTYISAESSGLATVTNTVVVRIESEPNYANVSCDVNIPVTITYRDAIGQIGTAMAIITLAESAVLFVPQAALSPVEIKATAMFSSTIGTYSGNNIFNVTGCAQIILKVVSMVDLLVPSYGYPVIPPCQSNPVAQCPGMFEIPLYPSATPRG